MRNFYECGPVSVHRCRNCVINFVWRADSGGKARERLDDFKLLWSLMQGAAAFVQHSRGHICPNQNQRSIGLQAFQQAHQREQVPGAGGSENCGRFSTAAAKTISSKSGSLLMAHDPVLKLRLLPQRVI